MAYATTTEFASFLGREIDPAEEGRVSVVLDVVGEAIDSYIGARVVSTDTKRNVSLMSGRRLFELPPGVRQEILGDWQASYAPNELLDASERMLLDHGGTGGTKRARNLSPRTPADIWETYNSATPTVYL